MLRQGSPLKVNLWSHNILQSRDGPFSVLRVRRCLGSVDTGSPTSVPGGNDIGGYVDTFIKQVDEHWTFIAKPEHMRGILQNDRRCQPTHRNLPKGETSTTTHAASRREKRKSPGLLTIYFSTEVDVSTKLYASFLNTIPETRETDKNKPSQSHRCPSSFCSGGR